jgi:hypothetical protein
LIFKKTALRLVLHGFMAAGITSCQAQKPVSAMQQNVAALQDKTTVTHTLMDQNWGLSTGTVTIPKGWGFAGGVVHATGGACTVTGTSPVMHIEAPDGSAGVVVMPSLRAQYVNDPNTMRQYTSKGCLVATGMTATDFLKGVVIPKARPGARVLEAGPAPLLEPMVAKVREQIAQGGMRGTPPVVSSARVRIGYARNGHPVEEYVSAMVVCSRRSVPGTRVFSVDCTADQLNLVYATASQLDLLAARKDLVDAKPNPAWQQRLAQNDQQYQMALQAQMNRQQGQNAQNAQAYLQNNLNGINNAAAQGQRNVEAIHAIGKASMDVDQQRQGAIDRSAQGTALSMTNSNIYTDPNTGKQVQMSDQYSHTYVNAESTMVQQTNSASGPIGGGWWTEMVPQY